MPTSAPALSSSLLNAQALRATPMGRRIALAVSILLHPALVPTWAFAAILYGRLLPTGMSDAGRGWLLAVLWGVTFGLPVALMAAAYYLGLVRDWQLRPKPDRLFSLWFTSALYLGACWGLQPVLPWVLFTLMAGLTGLALAKSIINLFYRMSGHAMGIAAFVGYWGAWAGRTGELEMALPLVACILGTGLVIWARLTLGAHTVGQVVSGMALGLAAGIGVGLLS